MDAHVVKHVRVAAVKQILVSGMLLLLNAVVFFVSAGWFPFRVLLFLAASVVHYFLSVGIQYRLNPWLLVKRVTVKREDSKRWDEVLMRATNLTMLIAVPAVAGLDVGRFGWLNLPLYFVWLGFVFFVASSVLLNWAMVTNKHFEPTVRIQEEHKVINSGPYRFVRHPGYLSGVLASFTIPLIVGSLFAFVPAGGYVVLLMLRTWLEDNTLQRELDGYEEYTKETRFRLFPGIW